MPTLYKLIHIPTNIEVTASSVEEAGSKLQEELKLKELVDKYTNRCWNCKEELEEDDNQVFCNTTCEHEHFHNF